MINTELTSLIIASAIEVHRQIGPGLLESHYERCMAYELNSHKVNFEIQKPLPLIYKGVKIEGDYRIDLLVENQIIVELKAVDRLTGIHEAQLLSYLKMANLEVGLLINFNVPKLRDGLKRMINTPCVLFS